MPDVYAGFDHARYALDTGGWDGDNPIFPQLVFKHRPSVIIEVGTWKGQSAINMALAAKALGLSTAIVCIDTWLGSGENWHIFQGSLNRVNGYPTVYYQFLANVCHHGLQDHIIPLPVASLGGARVLKNRGICADMVYLDGDHTEDAVLAALENFKLLVRRGGLLFGHDIQFKSVRDALTGFCENHQLSYTTKDNFWFIECS